MTLPWKLSSLSPLINKIYWILSILGLLTCKAIGNVHIATILIIHSHLWIWTKGPDAIRCTARGNQIVRSIALLNPILQGSKRIKHVWSGSPSAVKHTRDHEEPQKLGSSLLSAHSTPNLQKVIHRSKGAKAGVRPSVIHDDFPTAMSEAREICADA
jgi:hypothetical protein